MASLGRNFFSCFYALVLFSLATAAAATLSPHFYNTVCTEALPTIKRVVEAAINKEKRTGALLLRLHFHDCIANGCDGSVLLDNSTTFTSEKYARVNFKSLTGFDMVDKIKKEVDKVCRGPVVSCADILAVAARDSVVALGGPSWSVQLGRRDSTTSYLDEANNNLPRSFMDLPALINVFKQQGLDTKDLVALSGGHTIGFSQCILFKNRVYNESNIDPVFARARKSTCPPNGGDTNLTPLDQTAAIFDTSYFTNLVKRRGLLHTDQVLFNGGSTDSLVKTYSTNFKVFSADFADSMVKLGNIKPLTGNKGQIRVNCRKVN